MDGTKGRRFGTLLRAHRVAAGLSQEDLAERAHLSRRTITDLERGVTVAPYRETVALLTDALDLTERDRAELENAVDRARTPSTSESGGAAGGGHPACAGVDALLATKLAIPPARSGLIPRPHLMERLQAGLHGPLTLLSAPAGSGKTTLLSAWRTTPEGQETPLAWVSIDAGDNNPTRFWRYVLTALDRALPGVGSAPLALLRSSGAPSMEAVLTDTVNALDARAEEVVLILDDYHLIEAKPIHEMLTFLLDHRPPSLHPLLATRTDPPLPLARWRGRGEVTELRAADLRFTLEETRPFLRTVMGLTLSNDDVAALEAHTEGWVAGLQLAGLSLKGRSAEEVATFVAAFTGSQRYIVDYLLEEVLLRQPEEVQRFLLHTCILDRLCAPLCATVLEGEDPPAEGIAASQEMLELLERNNVFLVALDEERRWYRYHHLFAHALCQHQTSSAAMPDASILHLRASVWFEKKDLVEEAIVHAMAGGCYERAADLIPRSTRPVAFHGRMQGLSTWYRALPEATLRARPDLSIGYAWVLLDFRDVARAEKYLCYAEAALETTPDAYPADERTYIQALIEASRAIITALQSDADRAIPHALAVLDGLMDSHERTRSAIEISAATVRSAAGIALGVAYLSQGAAKEAADAFARVAFHNRGTEDMFSFVLGAVGEACAQRMAGDLDRARITYEQAIQWSADLYHAALLDGSFLTGLADILREQNELDEALERASQGMRLERALGIAGTERWVEWNACDQLILARIKQAQGDLDGALTDVHQARERLERCGANSLAAILTAFEAQLRLARGDVDAAVRWLQRAETHDAPRRFGLTPQVFVYGCEHLEIAPVQVLIAQGRASRDPAPVHRALALLEHLQEKAVRSDLAWLRAKTLVLQALARHVLGEMPAAFSALERALALAEPSRSMRLFLDEGPALGDLLRDRRTHAAKPDNVSAFLVALDRHLQGDVQKVAREDGAASRGQRLAELLTERELDVLRLLAVGQSTPEIARTLYVEVNTVRTHVKHLYSKLDIHSRDQALWRARELGLL